MDFLRLRNSLSVTTILFHHHLNGNRATPNSSTPTLWDFTSCSCRKPKNILKVPESLLELLHLLNLFINSYSSFVDNTFIRISHLLSLFLYLLLNMTTGSKWITTHEHNNALFLSLEILFPSRFHWIFTMTTGWKCWMLVSIYPKVCSMSGKEASMWLAVKSPHSRFHQWQPELRLSVFFPLQCVSPYLLLW